MKNKGIFVYKLISVIIVFIILLSMIIKTNDIKFKVIMIPFLLCSIFSIGQNICLLLNKNKFAKLFEKLYICGFLLFWFGILIIGSYSFIKERNYFSLLFTIPFWITGIYIVRKSLLGINSKKVIKKKESKFNFTIIASGFLVLSVLIIGIACLLFGIRDTYKLNVKTKDYLITNGYFKDYHIYDIDEDGTTYQLIYNYEVNGKEYTTATDYGVGYIPETNSIRKIKYNPNNPSEAILVGTNSSNFLIFFGAFFTLVGSIFVLLSLKMKGVFNKVKIDIIGTYVGFVMLIVGVGIILFQNGTTSSFIETIKVMGLWILIPLLFIVVGISQIVKCIKVALNSKKNHKNS